VPALALWVSLSACNMITGVDEYDKCDRRGCDARDDDDGGDTTSSGASATSASGSTGAGGACGEGTASLTLVVTGSGFKISDATGDLEVIAAPQGAEGSACVPRGERTLRALRDGTDFDDVVWGEGCTPVPASPSRCTYVLEGALTLSASAP
jgi:hypothetical protein